MAARASTDLIYNFGCSTPPKFQNPIALAVHLRFLVIWLFYEIDGLFNFIKNDCVFAL